MPLPSGRALGQYEIVALVGEGGMGEVYRARDTKLGRDVAIKVLPDAFAKDEARLDRFQREARLLAQLNHPAVATLHGLEESAQPPFLVMELVEGETLADRITRGPMPVDEALPLFVAIAEGLEAAHEKGIVHRDLKPANIKIAPDGKPKILDFGLAKALEEDPVDAESSHSPTMTRGATAMGTLLGTAAYMSPEQARAKTVDSRTDVWAFACCLYESLTGRRAFEGETTTDILAAVVHQEPDWARLPAKLPPKVDTLLRTALRRDPRRRLQHIGDARVALEDGLSEPPPEPRPVSVAATPAWRRGLPWAIVGILLAVLLWPSPAPPPEPVKRFAINLPPGGVSSNRFSVAVSPDGRTIVYPRGDRGQLYVRHLDRLDDEPLEGTEGARTPFFKSDGTWIGFFATGELKKIPVSGGTPVTVSRVGVTTIGATWTSDTIYFSNQGTLVRVPDSGGEPTPLVAPGASGASFATWPTMLPGGDAMVYAESDETGINLVLHSLTSGERRVLIRDGYAPRYVAPGYLVYQRGNSLRGVAFAPRTGEIGESIETLIEDVAWQSVANKNFALSAEGTLVYVPGVDASARGLVWVNRRGEARPLSSHPDVYQHPRLSPDGRRIAVRIGPYTGDSHIWVHDLELGTLSRLTSERRSVSPVWTPDGRYVTFGTDRPIAGSMFSIPADGSGVPEKVFERGRPSAWSPDGRVLAITDFVAETEILLVSDGEAQPFASSGFNEGGADFSPDGRFIVYISDETGRNEVYVRPFPGPGPKVLISTDGGVEVCWGRHGSEIFYRIGEKMMAVPVVTEPEFRHRAPVVLFEAPYELALNVDRRNYDVNADGTEFVMVQGQGDETLTQLSVVLNWTALLGPRP